MWLNYIKKIEHAPGFFVGWQDYCVILKWVSLQQILFGFSQNPGCFVGWQDYCVILKWVSLQQILSGFYKTLDFLVYRKSLSKLRLAIN
ncbi:MAG: hypothetical protein CFE23_09680 [Flavobacterium sp. BFFFF1]|nr:MAG: hypothetical protein CFE23_09680 [Flavobacterium sp. BFFFF1]